MTLRFYVLNVQHGSSIVVVHETTVGRYFGVIDCNTGSRATPRAIELFDRLGAKSLSFICLTHPHKDHFSGLFEIIKRFEKSIGTFYTCPLGDLLNNKPRLRKLSENLMRVISMSDGETERKAALEFVQILKWANDRKGQWEECSGFESRIAPDGFEEVVIKVIQPPRIVKGDIINRIQKSDPTILGHVDDNKLSIALQFEYCGITTILAGDSTGANWIERERYERNTGTKPDANAVVLPHHGSRHDNSESIIDRMFSRIGARFAITSANGISHPSPDVIGDLSARNIDPYCTNLMPVCGANVTSLHTLSGVEKDLARFLREHLVSYAVPQVCQGDIVVEITSKGDVSVTPQFNHFCGFRSNLGSLF